MTYLEARCRDFGVEITDATVQGVEKGGAGLAALLLESGERVTADLFVDASGFRAELLGRALEVPFKSYDDALFCNRAVIAGWPRTDEPIKPYTTAETMDAGWCWQIEHEHFLNRGCVFSSRFISDDDARADLLRKNPKIATEPRVVKFRSGRYERMWEGNVVGIGNASGFVEPLEASALQVIIVQCRALSEMLQDSEMEPGSGSPRCITASSARRGMKSATFLRSIIASIPGWKRPSGKRVVVRSYWAGPGRSWIFSSRTDQALWEGAYCFRPITPTVLKATWRSSSAKLCHSEKSTSRRRKSGSFGALILATRSRQRNEGSTCRLDCRLSAVPGGLGIESVCEIAPTIRTFPMLRDNFCGCVPGPICL